VFALANAQTQQPVPAKSTFGKLLLFTMGLAVAYVVIKSVPDIARYIKISSM
jgi:hypothetical protein